MSRKQVAAVARDAVRFGLVGGLGVLVDIGVFNLLLLFLTGHHVSGAPVFAKTVSVTAAIAANWVGNRWWAFRDRRADRPGAEALKFLVVSMAGSAIAMVCLVTSHYLLGFTTPIADNISANIIGLGLGSAFRFVAVRIWVFQPVSVGS